MIRFFRYYHSRTVDVIRNHIVTIVLTLNDNIIGYGHLDYEKDKLVYAFTRI